VSPAFGQQFHQELDGDPGPLDHGLSHEHLRVDRDAISPVHGVTPEGLRLRPSNQPNLQLADLISLQPGDIIHNSGGIAFGDAGAIR